MGNKEVKISLTPEQYTNLEQIAQSKGLKCSWYVKMLAIETLNEPYIQ